LTAELNDFIRDDVSKYFPHLVKYINVSLLEGTGRILGMLEPSIAQYATNVLEGSGGKPPISSGSNPSNRKTFAKVYVNALVTKIDEHSISYRIGNYSPTSNSVLPECMSDISDRKEDMVRMNCGVCVWAGGVRKRPFVSSFCSQLDNSQKSRFGVEVQ
jgi:NADH dehydrogenase FAD-containing subunit